MTILRDHLPLVISGHHSHPHHKLKLVTADRRPFMCDGCMEPGCGATGRYRCEHERCNFDLHTCCAAADSTLTHRLFRGATFFFLVEPPLATTGAKCTRTVCDACGDPVHGFVYHCFERDLDLHPCCAHLQERIFHTDGRVFQLRRRSASRQCGLCDGNQQRRREFWAYRSRVDGKDVDLHVACMKDMARQSWDAEYQRRAGGAQIVHASVPSMDVLLRSVPGKARRSSGFDRFWKMAGAVVSIVIAVIFGNPVAMMAAIAGPGGLLRGY